VLTAAHARYSDGLFPRLSLTNGDQKFARIINSLETELQILDNSQGVD